MRSIREILGLPFLVIGFVFIAIGILMAFGSKTCKYFTEEFIQHFN